MFKTPKLMKMLDEQSTSKRTLSSDIKIVGYPIFLQQHFAYTFFYVY